jgi:uncharacterized protein (DUF4415 family)
MRDEYDFSKAKRVGRVPKDLKVIKTIRLDPEVLYWLEVQGEKEGMGYQTFLNWFLRNAMQGRSSLEERVEKLERAVFKKK